MLDFGFYNEDCLPRMREYPDKFFDLAIVDPPYGSGLTEGGGMQRMVHEIPPRDSAECLRNQSADKQPDLMECRNRQTQGRFGGWFNRYKRFPEEWNQRCF